MLGRWGEETENITRRAFSLSSFMDDGKGGVKEVGPPSHGKILVFSVRIRRDPMESNKFIFEPVMVNISLLR